MDYYIKKTFECEKRDKDPTENDYLKKMKNILSAPPTFGVPPEPSIVVGNVFLGSLADAENIPMMKAYRMESIIICETVSPIRKRRIDDMFKAANIEYHIVPIEDDEEFMVRHYFEMAHRFINEARTLGHRVLIACPGVSRSGVLALSYLISQGFTLFEATRSLKDKRRLLLCNEGFMKQLVSYAREKCRLDNLEGISAPEYGRTIDLYRIRSAHLPAFL